MFMTMGVIMPSGCTELQRTALPCCLRYTAVLIVKLRTAAFEAVCAAVCGLLVQGQENGDLRDDFDPRDVAEDLISLLKGFGMVRAQLGLTTLPYKDIDQHVTRAVDTILVAYRASGGVGSA